MLSRKRMLIAGAATFLTGSSAWEVLRKNAGKNVGRPVFSAFVGGCLATLILASQPLVSLHDSRAALSLVRKGGAQDPRVILMSSNGAGLGHLTRLNAIQQQLKVNSE